tara:strand:- start:302 stop:988 length:687 start_codon:yes stop_codon:yes gene_type:complete
LLGKILVVEDEVAIQSLLALNLTRAGYQVDLATTGEEALKQVNYKLPDLIIVDWMLPVMSGIDLVRRLKKESRTQKIPMVFLTAKTDEKDKIEGLNLGVDDYLTKPFSPKELIVRIKNILKRTSPESTDESCEISGLKLDPVTRRVSGNNNNINLGPTEFKLLHFFMTHPNRVYSRAQLLDRVWGDHVFVEERTIDVHIRRLRRSLEPTGLHTLIKTTRGAGYSLHKI